MDSKARPKKLNHADTLLYEIYMLRFAVEAFLLHYRNLIEFLGKPKAMPVMSLNAHRALRKGFLNLIKNRRGLPEFAMFVKAVYPNRADQFERL